MFIEQSNQHTDDLTAFTSEPHIDCGTEYDEYQISQITTEGDGVMSGKVCLIVVLAMNLSFLAGCADMGQPDPTQQTTEASSDLDATENSGSVLAPALTRKICSIDSHHWAAIEASISNSVMTGYYITYHENGGWNIGNHCNEHVSHNGSHFWDSPDRGSPNVRIHRNMPDVALPNCVQAVFDKPDTGDPKCTVCF